MSDQHAAQPSVRSGESGVPPEEQPVSTADRPPAIVRIEPRRGWIPIDFRELWSARELFFFFTWRDVKVRYKQTLLGAAWAVLQPALNTILFTFVFGRLAKIPSDGIPYPLFAFCALVPWTFFQTGMSQAARSLVANANMLRKVYFPRLVMPASSVLAGVIDLLIGLFAMMGMVLYYGYGIQPTLVWLPFFLLQAAIAATGAGLWLSALNVQFRDVRYVLPFLTQFWMYATPIVYPSSALDTSYSHLRLAYGLNPMVGVVEGFRWSLLGVPELHLGMMLVSAASSLFLLVSGAFYFRRMEKLFADLV